LELVRKLLAQINTQLTNFQRDTNRILLEHLDFGSVLPPLDVYINLPAQSCETAVLLDTAHESKFFDSGKYTELYLPLRIKGRWIMLVANPYIRRIWRIIFDEWEWNDPLVENAIEAAAKGLKRLIISLRLKLVNDDWLGERKEAMWPFLTEKKN
jgi:hypothetical protein